MLVKQISNLFELMEFFVRAKKPVSVREIVEELSWPRSSVFNIVSTMVEHGYLYQPVPRGGYYPTTKWMELARDLSESQPLPESVHKLLVELMNQTGETLSLAAAEGVNAVLLDVVEPPAVIRYTANVGQRMPIHLTAAGRALLSLYSPSERTTTLNRIAYERYDNVAFSTAESVEKEIQRSANIGWFVNFGAYAEGLAGIGVPFPFRNRRNSIVIGAPVSRVEKRIDELGKLLRETVDRFLKENE
jgi:DNA-binding IclR family transcriptional regulator